MVIDPVINQLRLHVRTSSRRDTMVTRSLEVSDTLTPGFYGLTVDSRAGTFTLTRHLKEEAPGEVVDKGVLGDSIGRPVGFLWQPPVEVLRNVGTIRFNVVTPREASLQLVQELQVALPKESNIMGLSLAGEDPVRIARTMNAVLRQLRFEAERLKKANLTEIANTVDEQLAQAAQNLSQAENALENFKISTITLPTENVSVAPGISTTTNPVISSYFSDKSISETTRRDREQLQRIIKEAESRNGRLSVEALRASTAAATNPELDQALKELTTREAQLRSLKVRFTDEHPMVKIELDAIRELETKTIPAAAQRALATLEKREEEFDRRISGTSAELKKIPQRTIEEGKRQRDVAVAAAIYVDLQNRSVTSRLSEQTVMPDISIQDTAVPPRIPSSDTSRGIIVMAVAASLGIGLALALLLDRLDSRFRYPEQAVNELGLDILGAVPSYTAPRSQRLRLEQASQMVESFRSLALSVRSSFPAGTPVQLTVSSPGPSDGKSTVSINLANALADGGYRTLLIDGDTRRGQLHTSCPPITQSPGLLDYLAGEATLGEVVNQTELHVNLSLIPSGARKRQGPELLASQRMANMLRELRSQFDAIIVDSAPLAAGIDAFALGTATGAMLMVLRSGETDRRLAGAKLNTLDRMPIRLLGAVLNDIKDSTEYRFYRYLDNYGEVESAPEVALLASSTNNS
jgi:capsular exopolysaccharide synthesis family protein